MTGRGTGCEHRLRPALPRRGKPPIQVVLPILAPTLAVFLIVLGGGCASLSRWKTFCERGRQFEERSMHRAAEKMYRDALKDAALFGVSEAEQAEIRLQLGRCMLSQGKDTESITLFNQAVSTYEKEAPDSALLFDALARAACALEARNNFTAAESYRAKMVSLSRRIKGEGLFYAGVLVDYALCALAARKADLAAKAVGEAVRILDEERPAAERREGGPRLLMKIAGYYRQAHDHDLCEKYLRRAVAETETLFYANHPDCLYALQHLEVALESSGKTREAEAVGKRLKTILATGDDPEGEDVGKYYDGKGPRTNVTPFILEQR